MDNSVHHHPHQIKHSKLHLMNLLLINTVCILYNPLEITITIILGQQVAGNADGFVQTIINDMESLYTVKPQRSYSLNT